MAKKQKNNLRKEAKGRPCLARIPAICNGNPETVVLAHLNNKLLFGAGMGIKVPDIFGAHCCSNCHDVFDGRLKTDIYTDEELLAMFYEAVFRTQNILLQEGKI